MKYADKSHTAWMEQHSTMTAQPATQTPAQDLTFARTQLDRWLATWSAEDAVGKADAQSRIDFWLRRIDAILDDLNTEVSA